MDTRTTLILGLLLLLGIGLSVFIFSGPSTTSGPNSTTLIAERVLAETIVESIDHGANMPANCPPLSQISIPADLVFEPDGSRKSELDIGEGFWQLFCLLDAISPNEEGVSDQNLQRLLRIYDGVDVRFPNGVVVPGTQRSVRAGLFYMIMIGVAFSETQVLGDGQCGELRNWINNGATLEKRVLGFALYMVLEGSCIQESPTGSTSAMLQRTGEGDIDAAVQLVKYWNIDHLADIAANVRDRDWEELDVKIGMQVVMIEESRDEQPLISIAATLEMINLMGLKRYPHMLFR